MSKEDDIEKIIKEIQTRIEYDEEIEFSKKVINEYRNPSNFGIIENPDAVGRIKGPCGDTMQIMLKIDNGIIINVRFWTDGCGTSIACGSMLTKMIKGKTIEKIINITSEKLNDELDGLPENHVHCTVLAVNTLKKTIKNLINKEKKDI
ncbi:iron-sulfur cluster assembly scaffold protein [Thermoplasmatales archaeon SG8-52-1]|nr:MAG: iron-sulfur cluster assembly scaffold protein [Thermoplasmatales archaeon SG8-52-1]